ELPDRLRQRASDGAVRADPGAHRGAISVRRTVRALPVKVAWYTLLVVASVLVALPLFLAFSYSFMSDSHIASFPQPLLPIRRHAPLSAASSASPAAARQLPARSGVGADRALHRQQFRGLNAGRDWSASPLEPGRVRLLVSCLPRQEPAVPGVLEHDDGAVRSDHHPQLHDYSTARLAGHVPGVVGAIHGRCVWHVSIASELSATAA